VNIFWFRRDLRLEDNAGLFHALSGDTEVLPIFIFDTNILSELPKDDPRVTFIHRLLEKINAGLKKHERSLAVFHGDPESVFKKLIETHAVSAVFANRDYEPYGTKRDAELENMLARHNIAFHTFKDQVIFETDEIAKDDGSPYIVFTPYSKKWKERFAKTNLSHYASGHFLKNIAPHSYPFLSLDDIHFTKSEIAVPDFDISDDFIMQYEQTRNFPENQTSRLGPHLRFGSGSVREIIAKASAAQNPTFLNELIWREFFMQVLWHFPQTVTKSFRPKYDNIKWSNAEADFKKWCEGKTGYPIVDAGMRELNATGFMHNRVRMVTASFLCKHLLIDWRLGEAWFAEKLLDYEQSSNIGNWQWAAGSGVDAAPYFRIFNPTEQLKKFDKELSYIRKWIPEFGTVGYPRPMVDHKEARERCLEAYKKAVS
jgi:deoxyribodipyrimidine photo-lyase